MNLEKIYNDNGVIRVKKGEKAPIKGEIVNKKDYKKCSLKQWLDHDGNYALLGGERSGGLEILDFDLKNTENKSFMSEYKDLVLEQLGPGFLKLLTIQKTPSGGFHFLYRCKNYEGSRKLAKVADGKEAIIETRGEGGYALIAPSEGYEVIQGSLDFIATISNEERDVLIGSALAMSEYEPPVAPRRSTRKSASDEESLFARYDQEATIDDVVSVLATAGWKEETSRGSKVLLTRPGKASGISADVDMHFKDGKDMALLYVYTSSTEFEPGMAYKPSAVVNMCLHGGDWSATHKYLKDLYPDGEKEPTVRELTNPLKDSEQVKQEEEESIFDMLNREYRVTDKTEVEDEPVILSIKGIPILSAGNVAAISGRVKSGKSAVVNAIISKAIDQEAVGFEMFEVEPSKGQAIIHIDTEQSLGKQKGNLNFWILNRTSLRSTPDNYYSYNFKSFTVREAREYLVGILDGAARKHGGIHMVMIDGLSEFVKTVNDEEGSVTAVKLIMELSSIYKCGFIVNIHTNPGGEVVKQRGHLGSEIQRKAESVLNISKEMNESHSTLQAHFLRNGDPVQFGDIHIGYNQEKRMHEVVSVADYDEDPAEKYVQQARLIGGKSKQDAIRFLSKHYSIAISAAKRIITDLQSAGYIEVTEEDKVLIRSHIYEID